MCLKLWQFYPCEVSFNSCPHHPPGQPMGQWTFHAQMPRGQGNCLWRIPRGWALKICHIPRNPTGIIRVGIEGDIDQSHNHHSNLKAICYSKSHFFAKSNATSLQTVLSKQKVNSCHCVSYAESINFSKKINKVTPELDYPSNLVVYTCERNQELRCVLETWLSYDYLTISFDGNKYSATAK